MSPQDCTGCELCVHVCPDDALKATPILDVLAPETARWDFMKTIPNRGELFDKSTVRWCHYGGVCMFGLGAAPAAVERLH